MSKCTVIYNPVATNFQEAKLEQIEAVLRKVYSDVNLVQSEYAGHTVVLARQHNHNSDLMISYGGDGTFSELIKGIWNETNQAVVSHIPIGTANDLKRNFGLAKDPIKSAELIRDGVVRPYDLFTLNHNPFAYVAAFGFLANVPCHTSAKLKQKYKYLAYLIQGANEIITKPFPYDMIIECDGRTFSEQAITVIITNSIGFGGMKLFKGVELDDHQFEVTLIRDMKKSDMLKIIRDVLIKRFDLTHYSNTINHFKAHEMTIKFQDSMPLDPIDLDGNQAYVSNSNHEYKIERQRTLWLQLPKR